MNVSQRWLKALAPSISESAEALAERLTRTAVPVDEVVWLGEGLRDVVVGRVDRVEVHPNADRLVLCAVDRGQGEPVQVVTGASVVVEGAFYPFVGIGQALPDGEVMKRVKLRGEYSEGMLCSERELRLGRDAAGIMRLHGDFTPGSSIIDALDLDDHRLVLEVTPNRPDLLGHLGVAREVAPGGQADLVLPGFPGHVRAQSSTHKAETEGTAGGVTVRIEDPEGCPRYMGAVIRGVTVGPSPEWLAGYLRAVGLQPINNIVDATNYVLYELNQPVHAFDLNTLRGPEVVVRRAREAETLRTLDGKDRELDAEILAIADAEGACALAGVMGGEASEVSEETTDVFLECAHFDPKRVRRGARKLGLDTDASYRFQRGIDPEGLPNAIQRLIELVLTVAGGRLDGEAVDVNPRPAGRTLVSLRPTRVDHVLGVELDRDTITECLAPIGFEASGTGDGSLDFEVPTWRPDVEREIDLIEEVARRHGYERLPSDLRPFRATEIPEDTYVAALDGIRDFFVGLGFLEAKTAPFWGDGGQVRVLNPLSERESSLRDRLLPGLVQRVEYNFARGRRDLRLFELGTVFMASGAAKPEEEIRLAAIATGRRAPPHWSGNDADWDGWDLKWILEAAVALADPGAEVRPVDGSDESGSEALLDQLVAMTPDGRAVGWGGRLRAEGLELPPWAGALWGIELGVRAMHPKPGVYRPLPVYPAVERDLAVIVPRTMVAAEVDAVIRDAAPKFLEDLSVFDVYKGESISEGARSIAWRLRFQAVDRTLTDKEVDAAMRRITSALEEKLNVRVRGA